jgi:Flp pilus assembly protein TadG
VRHFESRQRRLGATVVEFAIVAAAGLLLIYGLIVGATGVYRYQEVAHLAREGSRYAAMHGGQYQKDGIDKTSGVKTVASDDDIRSYLLPKAVALDKSKLTIHISWSAPSSITPKNIPTYTIAPSQVENQNYVTVSVTYEWKPEVFLFGPRKLTSTSTMPMSY